jgi:hypothetical protein
MTKSLQRTHATPSGGAGNVIEVRFSAFGWQALSEEARRAGVSIEDLVVHAAMYYLADAPQGRFAHGPGRRPGAIAADGRARSDDAGGPC